MIAELAVVTGLSPWDLARDDVMLETIADVVRERARQERRRK